jgi:DNA-binding NarL/FixJ family response regulator
VRTHVLAKETHDLHEDMHLMALEEIPLPKSRADERIEHAGLRPREEQIARLLAHTSLTHEEIAAEIECKLRTVDTHSTSIYKRLGVEGRRELLWLAAQ